MKIYNKFTCNCNLNREHQFSQVDDLLGYNEVQSNIFGFTMYIYVFNIINIISGLNGASQKQNSSPELERIFQRSAMFSFYFNQLFLNQVLYLCHVFHQEKLRTSYQDSMINKNELHRVNYQFELFDPP